MKKLWMIVLIVMCVFIVIPNINACVPRHYIYTFDSPEEFNWGDPNFDDSNWIDGLFVDETLGLTDITYNIIWQYKQESEVDVWIRLKSHFAINSISPTNKFNVDISIMSNLNLLMSMNSLVAESEESNRVPLPGTIWLLLSGVFIIGKLRVS